ncbi:MAG: hypothetical protein JNL55_00725 [Steroidobacter sp.]|nr:hypothetical protein [Steroidobacter sp.]
MLIYNHGGLHPHFSATFQTEFLASHGYVVVSIGHPGANEIERFPDGTTYKNDGKQWMVQPANARQLPLRERWEDSWIKSDISLFVQDVSFVLDRLTQLNTTPKHRFQSRLDLEKVGALGWSLGGLISLQASRDEPRIKAAANLDGWPFGLLGPKGVVTLGSEKPLLLMFADSPDWGQVPANFTGNVDAGEVEAGSLAATHYWTMLRRTTADWYRVTIARTIHDHFSDNLLFQPEDAQLMPPRVAHEIINGYALAFFDRYVKGSNDTAPLLSGERSFPEARLLRGK